MKCANARKLDRKSGVRLGERGAPVWSLPALLQPKTLHVYCRGIPHSQTPAPVVGLREQQRLASSAMLLPYTKAKECHAKER
jgi:hypothetical protein